MTASKPGNLTASVRQRLMNHALKTGEDFQTVLARYGCERLLYRLSLSPYASQFTLKGALMFLVWTGEQYRPTKDMDLTASRKRTAAELASIFKALCDIAVEDDGLRFSPDAVLVEPIREDSEYREPNRMLLTHSNPSNVLIHFFISLSTAEAAAATCKL